MENKYPVIVTLPQLPQDESKQERKRYDTQLQQFISDLSKQTFLMFNDVVEEINT